jgi:hypothetical protein
MKTFYSPNAGHPAADNEQSQLIFGTRAVIEAVQAGKDVDKILKKTPKSFW